jgi:starch synthase
LNGVDYENWDPAHDKYLAAFYDARDLSGKRSCKIDLINHFNLQISPEQPLLGMTTRLNERKGLDLVQTIIPKLVEANIGFVLQGTGEERYQYAFLELQNHYPDLVGVEIGYSSELAHKIIAGADIFLMPSRYEPCGLDQLYALRYGTIPVVRAVGGLEETIVEYDPNSGQGTGFKFSRFETAEFWAAIKKAFSLYNNASAWENMRHQAMQQEFGWPQAAAQYVKAYEKARENRSAVETREF